MKKVFDTLSAGGRIAGFRLWRRMLENGKRLFMRDGCYECHGYTGQGGIRERGLRRRY